MPYHLKNPIHLPLESLAPHPEHFFHPSRIHGQGHVARVIVHSFVLIDALGLEEHAERVWAAAYVHDIGRVHDGRCRDHGQYALARLPELPQVTSLLAGGGVSAEDWEGISVAVENHCRAEIPRTHPHWTLTAILKDADGLDRVRIGDLNPRYLRFPESQALVPFAEALYAETHKALRPGPDHFAALWTIAQGLLSCLP
jgi:hypothetical protein